MAELEVDNVSLSFGGLRVLSDVSLSAEAGELLALIGPNGAGKTSLFNCISGLYSGSGEIRFRGENLKGRKPHDIGALGIARTFQHAELFPQMSVIENVLTGRHTLFRTKPMAEMLFLPRVKAEEAIHREAVEKVIAFVELGRYRNEQVESLPFGIQNPRCCCWTSRRRD
jgi:branched-chain amino acid transport system ATP-binding protein